MSCEKCKKILAEALERIKRDEHVVDLMKARRAEELENIREEIDLSEVGDYVVDSDKDLELELMDFEYDDPLEMVFLFACFSDEYLESNIVTSDSIDELIEKLKEKKDENEVYANIAAFAEKYWIADCDFEDVLNYDEETDDDD